MNELATHRLFTAVFLLAALTSVVFFVTVLPRLNIFDREQPVEVTNYLKEESAVLIESEEETVVLPVEPVLFEYIEVIDGCGPYFNGPCLNVRSGPGQDYDKVTRLRKGIVLKVGGRVVRDGQTWYKIVFDEWIRYPERVTGDWYVAADYVRILLDEGERDLADGAAASSTKRIVVDRSEQMLYAYEDGELFMSEPISTGIELTPTPRGTFTIFKKTPSRYMQGPLPGISEKYYDLPGVPWNLYFSQQGAVIHGAYWHDQFGKPWSSGCVNMPLAEAQKLYTWADVGTTVVVRD
ncbi:MAG: L,D-transpeptidase family protein [Candidatus Liptonbacteria bacterium]|nr:L,D-transpeptidase family protein [Candidatus Liptonbacteria bacterium]